MSTEGLGQMSSNDAPILDESDSHLLNLLLPSIVVGNKTQRDKIHFQAYEKKEQKLESSSHPWTEANKMPECHLGPSLAN